MKHSEHAKRRGLAVPCTAHHARIGGGCLNCGWPGDQAINDTPKPMVPLGMVEVTRGVFFALLYADHRDIMPNQDYPEFTLWKVKGREVWGWSTPGWKNPGDAKTYAVAKAAMEKPTGVPS